MTSAACGLLLAIDVARSQVATTKPAGLPPLPTSNQQTGDLEAAATKAFEANDYATALPLLKDLSVRERDKPDAVAPLLEKIRVCEKSLADQSPVIEGINAPRIAHAKPAPGQTYELALQKLGNFNYDSEKGGNIPADVQALGGSTVKLHGYMIPIDQSEKITKFVLVPSLFACCFGQPPAIQHTVVVTCPAGKAVSYYPEQITVTGTLGVIERKDEGFITSIFEVTAASIRPMMQP